MPTPVPATEFARVYRGGGVWLRGSASNNSAGVIKAPKGQIVGLLGTSGSNWYRATYRGKVGYVPAARLQRVTLAGRGLAQQYARIIVVARRQQHMEVWENGRLMLISAVTTGRPELPTPTGTMRVLRNESPHLMRSPWGPESPFWYTPGWAHYTVMFKGGGFYFHDTRARPENGYGIGTNVLHVDPDGVERTGSRGCANTPMWAMRQLYGWARIGDTVVIMDEPYSAAPMPELPEAPAEPTDPTLPTDPTDPSLPPGTIDPPIRFIRPPMARPYVF
jgi:lipoprotein-anchoring transpeptidase ErfK/SrfK